MTVAPSKKEGNNIETRFVNIGNHKIYNLFAFIDSLIIPGSGRRACKSGSGTIYTSCNYCNRLSNRNGVNFVDNDLIPGRKGGCYNFYHNFNSNSCNDGI